MQKTLSVLFLYKIVTDFFEKCYFIEPKWVIRISGERDISNKRNSKCIGPRMDYAWSIQGKHRKVNVGTAK